MSSTCDGIQPPPGDKHDVGPGATAPASPVVASRNSVWLPAVDVICQGLLLSTEPLPRGNRSAR